MLEAAAYTVDACVYSTDLGDPRHANGQGLTGFHPAQPANVVGQRSAFSN